MPHLRIGHGYDAHRFCEDRPLILGGVTVPCDKGLLGHSDADVLLHALMDAMLGALALGDIGKHFPDTDEAYRGADSLQLLIKTYELCKKNGYILENVDITVLAQMPKLAPYIESMRETVAKALVKHPSAISIKATTTEKMGFEGRGEGASALATCLLSRR